ncbi:MAG: hypothetical protein WDM76_05505 [Limisphaerales bacterium]
MPKLDSPLRIAFLTHEPFYPPSGGGSAEAVYLVEEMVRRGHESMSFVRRSKMRRTWRKNFASGCINSRSGRWDVTQSSVTSNISRIHFFLERMVADAARTTKFDLLLSQHAISAVAAGN